MNRYYLTTPIYYVNAAPHIGHAYTTIAADAVRRWKTMQGYEAVLTTGTDEHGQKVARSAANAGRTPQQFTDIISEEFRRQWEALELKIDRFMRTTDPRHHEVVKDLFRRCLANGYIYKGSYVGQYCVFCELYVNEAKPGDPCPDCGRPTETVTEENFYFRLSAFTDKLLELYERNPQFVQPEIRRNEAIAFVKQGLKDLSISRTTISWGIPVPDEDKHVFYVWFDALSTYMSAVAGEDRWPADLHLIGKEILRFHVVYWPAFLWAAGLPLPKQVFAHGFLLFEESKMSKSRGNIVRPDPIRKIAGIDALRYFLLREVVFGHDGSFSYDALVARYNADLANGLGNLASRTLTMIRSYCGGQIPDSKGSSDIADQARDTISQTGGSYDRLEFSRGLETAWGLLSAVDKYIVESAPWKLSRGEDPASQELLKETLYTAAEVLRISSVLLYPVLPQGTEKIWKQLGMSVPLEKVHVAELDWGQLPAGQAIGEIEAVYPRLDTPKAVEEMRALEMEETARQAQLLGQSPAPPPVEALSEKITIDDFAKVDLRVGLVVKADRVPKSDKLVHLEIDLGEGQPRTVLAGIAEAYTPEQLIGRKVVVVANLQPRKMRGIESNGMVVAASVEGGSPVLAGFLEEIPAGARLR